MTITDEILTCANQLANVGKKPTVALIKAKLSQPVPLATIISTLKNWQHQPDFISVNEAEQPTAEVSTNDNKADIDSLLQAFIDKGQIKETIQQSLEQELDGLKQELSEIKLLIKSLSKQ